MFRKSQTPLYLLFLFSGVIASSCGGDEPASLDDSGCPQDVVCESEGSTSLLVNNQSAIELLLVAEGPVAARTSSVVVAPGSTEELASLSLFGKIRSPSQTINSLRAFVAANTSTRAVYEQDPVEDSLWEVEPDSDPREFTLTLSDADLEL